MKNLFFAFLFLVTAGLAQARSNQVTITGKAIRVMAIGGETTGLLVETDLGGVEVDLSHTDFEPSNGEVITVTGTYKIVRGVEVRNRKILVASSASAVTAGADQEESSVTVQGTLEFVGAIGGETTGTALNTSKGSIEIDLSKTDLSRSPEGTQLEVTGQYQDVSGIEIATRKVLVVKKGKVLTVGI